ncbi:MAG TPA: glutamate-5-semialdehyde dehydrogenase [Verrucomicrobiales bacterium]|nr:glutamate-5-semialdehyde dehydrogenase [Verrucomicrobiales bacterium]
MSLTEQMTELARHAKTAAHQMTRLSTADKNVCLITMADAIETNAISIKEANAKDMETARGMDLSQPMLDRLLLDDTRIAGMAKGLREVAALPDPVGRVLDERNRPSGLKLKKIAAPIGVVVMIYESRPNVTADAAGLCFKSSNVTILRGGKEALHSNQIIARLMTEAGKNACDAFPPHAIQVVSTTDRAAIAELLSLTELVDLCIPRGGEGLIRAVADCSKVPVIKHYKGICSVYLDAEADAKKAIAITVNSKTHRPGVCNAMETLLVDKTAAPTLLPQVAEALRAKGVELRVDETGADILSEGITAATPTDWDTEFLDLICAVRVVDGVGGAIEHINTHGSGHTDSIVTENETTARRFQQEVDSSTVFWNASTRFSDGGEFGMGAEIGISTDKIGARGPMGLEELTTYKWIGEGDGLTRD